jgi:hypothetical protein
MPYSKLKYWNVYEINSNTIKVSLKDKTPFNRLGDLNTLILFLYQLTTGGSVLTVPLSPIRARFSPNRLELQNQLGRENPYLVFDETYDQVVDFKEHKIQFPITGAIEADFNEGVVFSFKKLKDKDKLLNLLEKSYHSFFIRYFPVKTRS